MSRPAHTPLASGSCRHRLGKALVMWLFVMSLVAVPANAEFPRPTARFTISPNPAPLGQTVTFDARNSDGGSALFCMAGADIQTYEWDLDGNGTFETVGDGDDRLVTRTYSANANISVTLRVSTRCDEDTDTQQLVSGDGGTAACLTGEAVGGPALFLASSQAIVAARNQRFGVLTNDGLFALIPKQDAPPGMTTVPTSRGVSILFSRGVVPPGRYAWRLPLDPGQRIKRVRNGMLVVLDEAGRRLMKITVVRSGSARAKLSSAQTQEEPPSAGVEGDGIYADYPEGSDVEGVNVVPVGDPQPLDCDAIQSPGHKDETPTSSEDAAGVEFRTEDDATLPRRARNTDSIHAALAGSCHGFVGYPFRAGVVPGFLGYEYSRSILYCEVPVGAYVKFQTAKISKAIGGRFVGRRTHHRSSLGNAAALAQARTVCRNHNRHRWRSSSRFTIFARARPYVLTGARRGYKFDDCG